MTRRLLCWAAIFTAQILLLALLAVAWMLGLFLSATQGFAPLLVYLDLTLVLLLVAP